MTDEMLGKMLPFWRAKRTEKFKKFLFSNETIGGLRMIIKIAVSKNNMMTRVVLLRSSADLFIRA